MDAPTDECAIRFEPCFSVLQTVMSAFRRSMVLAILIAIGCNGFVGDATVRTATAAKTPSTTALDRARVALSRRAPSDALGDISTAGYSFSRELEIGGGLHVIVVSSNLAGG